mgnify:CR=1 FL=1
MRLSTYILEIFLAQLVFYLIFWLSNDYLASLLSLSLGGVFLVILVLALITELVEKSRISSWYYQFMVTGILAPLLSFLIYIILNQGLDWIK